jgi:hypothetical protein
VEKVNADLSVLDALLAELPGQPLPGAAQELDDDGELTNEQGG